MQACIACGMPMRKNEDYAGGDTSKNYCRYCCNSDGTMHSFEEKKASLIKFNVTNMGLDEKAAEEMVLKTMKNLPAWKGYF